MTEEWRPVVGYEGQYEVSNLGRVWSLDRKVPHRNGTPRLVKGRLMVLSPGNQYGHLGVCLGNRNKKMVHSLVAEAFLGPRPPGQDIRHINGNRVDNRVENLSYGTRSENCRECYDYGGHNGRGKLRRSEVIEIRRLADLGEKTDVLAEKFGVCRRSIQSILSGETFSYIK